MGIKNVQKYIRERYGGEFVSGKYVGYHTTQFGDTTPSSPQSGITATGGLIGEYTSPDGTIYRSHTFNNTGSWVVSSILPYGGADYDILVVGGGGGGGNDNGGGGGAGAVHYLEGQTATAQTYPVTI